MVKRYLFYSVVVLFCVLFSGLCFAAEMLNTGRWPASWPKELEPYRKVARTVDVACGIQEKAYEIPIDSRDEFEKMWPYILKLMTKGSLLIIEKSPSTYWMSTLEVGVRILAPPDHVVGLPDGTKLEAKLPWPDYIKSPSGELPEYVTPKYGKWTPWPQLDQLHGDRYRARVDIVLVTDGKVIDPNRISLPLGTSVIKKNKKPGLKTYRNEAYGFEVKYPEDIFALVPTTMALPKDYKTNYRGVKLISEALVDMIGKEQCYYGESDFPHTCRAENEGGISFIPVNSSLQKLVSSLNDSCRTNVTVAGRQSVRWSIGVEGAGLDYYYIPLAPNRTLVIVRLYEYGGLPKPDLFNQVISTLVIK